MARPEPPERPRDRREVCRIAVSEHDDRLVEDVVAVLERLEDVEVRAELAVLVSQLFELDVRRRHTVRIEEGHGMRRYTS